MQRAIKQQGLLLGTVLLLISNIFVKGLGFLYRVVLVRLLGTEGMGLIEMVTPLFSFLLVLAGCGIQPALSQIIAGKGRSLRNDYFRTALLILLISGSLVTLAAYAFAPLIIRYFVPDQRIYLCFRAILPAIFIISIASAWRGCFQGMRQVSSLGMSQNIEQLCRVLLGIYLARLFLPGGLEIAVSAASYATVAGELAGFAYLVLRMRWLLRRETPAQGLQLAARRDFFAAARDLLRYGLPMTGGRLAASGIMMLQAFLIPYCLQFSGHDITLATQIYGRFSGVAMALLHLPGIFTSALSVSVLPAVAESMTFEHTGRILLKKRVSASLHAAIAFTLPGMLLLFLFAAPLCSGIFHTPEAAPILKLLAPGGIFFYMQLTLASVLQGLGEVRRLLVNNILAGVVLLCGILLLCSQPALGIYGAAMAVDLAWLTGFTLNLLSFRQSTYVILPWRKIALPPALSLLSAIAAYYVLLPLLKPWLPEMQIAATILHCLAVAVIYLAALASLGGLKLSEK